MNWGPPSQFSFCPFLYLFLVNFNFTPLLCPLNYYFFCSKLSNFFNKNMTFLLKWMVSSIEKKCSIKLNGSIIEISQIWSLDQLTIWVIHWELPLQFSQLKLIISIKLINNANYVRIMSYFITLLLIMISYIWYFIASRARLTT